MKNQNPVAERPVSKGISVYITDIVVHEDDAFSGATGEDSTRDARVHALIISPVLTSALTFCKRERNECAIIGIPRANYKSGLESFLVGIRR